MQVDLDQVQMVAKSRKLLARLGRKHLCFMERSLILGFQRVPDSTTTDDPSPFAK
uniref:Uncharacterized protein n=1 Tax=Curvibacter symbiont subsp. Hydra magnipapillata TaxID=667019 RepID=C9Y973_CURXX|nr:hypothetical protein Csp_A06740 [Curvibacter putative symbiont of Hydra magnipapillata]